MDNEMEGKTVWRQEGVHRINITSHSRAAATIVRMRDDPVRGDRDRSFSLFSLVLGTVLNLASSRLVAGFQGRESSIGRGLLFLRVEYSSGFRPNVCFGAASRN